MFLTTSRVWTNGIILAFLLKGHLWFQDILQWSDLKVCKSCDLGQASSLAVAEIQHNHTSVKPPTEKGRTATVKHSVQFSLVHSHPIPLNFQQYCFEQLVPLSNDCGREQEPNPVTVSKTQNKY